MPFIGPGMNSNTVRSVAFDIQGHAQHIGVIASTSIAYRGQLVDIDTQTGHSVIVYLGPG